VDTRIIATTRVLDPIIRRFQEAAPDAHPARDPRFEGLTDVQRASLVAGLTNALGALHDSEKVPGVMATPQNQIASLLQTMVVQHSTGAEPLGVLETLEAKFDTHDWIGWLGTFWEMVKHAKKFPWRAAPEGAERVAAFDKDSARMALFGDWGTGLYGAPHIAQHIVADPGPVDVILHLGDVYYSGKADEFQSRFLALWPTRAGALNRALNGNHEMYCGGQPYVDAISSPAFAQGASGFAYQNDHWIIVGLDSAYDDHDLANGQAAWLGRIVAAKDPQQHVVLFSHHQPFSFLSQQGPKLVDKLRGLLDGHQIFAWYWGHEHECVIYDQHPQWQLYGRCVGHAGMPEFRPDVMGPAVPTRQFRRFPAKREGGIDVPPSTILDGPNPFIAGEEKKFTPHGYMMLRFEADGLYETVYDADGTVALAERALRPAP
jgi:Calcineurin-like phosphoesterase